MDAWGEGLGAGKMSQTPNALKQDRNVKRILPGGGRNLCSLAVIVRMNAIA
jgi:hypothetical protein